MSTRATYIFAEQGARESDKHVVYVHSDGYPSGAADYIEKAKSLAWELPRYEPDEFAAAFVAANKDHAGGVRLFKYWDDAVDIEYCYEVYQRDDTLRVQAFKVREASHGLRRDLLVDIEQDRFGKWAEENDE